MANLEERFALAWGMLWNEMETLGIPTARMQQQIQNLGAIAAAHRCLQGRRTSDGFAQLAQKGRLDLSLEALILKPEWGGLFTDEEANEALTRLLEAGWSFRGPHTL